jgi:hypothetical protein
LIYLLSHDLKAGQPQQLSRLILEANPSNEIKELAELFINLLINSFCILKIFKTTQGTR